MIRIEVVYALSQEQVLVELEVEEGISVREAIERSGIPQRFPGLDLADGNVGVFGEPAGLNRPAHDGDRVEIYRKLIAEPGDNRRKRARRPR